MQNFKRCGQLNMVGLAPTFLSLKCAVKRRETTQAYSKSVYNILAKLQDRTRQHRRGRHKNRTAQEQGSTTHQRLTWSQSLISLAPISDSDACPLSRPRGGDELVLSGADGKLCR